MKPHLATQLIVFNGHVDLEQDPDAVLSSVAAAGFSAVETQLADASRLRERLAAHGLRHAAAHVTTGQLQEPQRWIDYLGITGAKDICTSGFLQWHQRTPSDHEATAKTLNEAGRKLRSAGIHLHYHNHDFELIEHLDSNISSLDYLASRLDPSAVDLCVDIGWVHRAQVEVEDFLRRHLSQIGILHLKDWDGQAWVPLGQGAVDFTPVLSLIPQMPNLRWLTCEQDTTPSDPARCLRLSREWCRQNLSAIS